MTIELEIDQALPLELAELHRRTQVEERVSCSFPIIEPARSSAWGDHEQTLHDLFEGAGFGSVAISGANPLCVRAIRARSLPDTVGPRMRLLVCGLNPSLHAADAGVGFVSPGNRFWPAAADAGLVTCHRDPWHAIRADGIGMTDLVKRATRQASELTAGEYGHGVARVERLCARLQPGAVCMVGLAGWRAAVDRNASAGVQPRALGGRPVYVMPSTSGLNARTSLSDLIDHLRAAAALAG